MEHYNGYIMTKYSPPFSIYIYTYKSKFYSIMNYWQILEKTAKLITTTLATIIDPEVELSKKNYHRQNKIITHRNCLPVLQSFERVKILRSNIIVLRLKRTKHLRISNTNSKHLQFITISLFCKKVVFYFPIY